MEQEPVMTANAGYPPVELAGTYADAPTSGGGTRPQSQVEQRAITVVRCCAKLYCAPVTTFPSPCLFPGIVSRRQWTNISGMFRASVPTSGGLVAWTDSTPCRPTVALRDVKWERSDIRRSALRLWKGSASSLCSGALLAVKNRRPFVVKLLRLLKSVEEESSRHWLTRTGCEL